MTGPIVVDHLELLRHGAHRLVVVAELRSAIHHGGVVAVDVNHEHDDACCRRQPWDTTFAELLSDCQPRRRVA